MVWMVRMAAGIVRTEGEVAEVGEGGADCRRVWSAS
jgi:hypothetical protein